LTRPYTQERKLEIIRLLWHKLKQKQLGPQTALWVRNGSLYRQTELLGEVEYLKWTDAEALSQSPDRKPAEREKGISIKSRKRA
jgi:hypothetical protein